MASTKPTPMEVISLLDSEDSEEEGRTCAVSRGKSALTKCPTSMKPPPAKATRHRRLIKAEDSDSDDDSSDPDGGAECRDLGKEKEEINLPTSHISSELASQDGRRRGGATTSTSSLTAHHHDDVVDDSDSDAEGRGPRRGRRPGVKRGTGPPSSTIVTKKPKKTGGQKEGGPSSSILQFMRKVPGGAASTYTGNGGSSGNGTGIGRKRPASQLLQPPPPPKMSQELWIDKHRPKKAVDLSIPPQKVKQVRQWLATALEQAMNKLLILRGPPGVGKSTMAEVLAEEMGLEVLGWTEAAGVQAWRGEGDEEDRGLMASSQRGEFAIPYVSQADDFGTFLGGAAYQPLVVTTSPSKKSLYQLSQEASSTRGRGRLFLIQELPSQVDHTSNTSSTYTQRALSALQASLQSFLLQSVHPAVLIYTECESSGGETLLERILSRAILQDPRVQQIQIRPTTDLKLRKVLERIAGEEGVRFTDTHEVEDLVASCNGDVRHAIMKLQFQYGHRRKVLFSSSQRSSCSTQSPSDGGGGGDGGGTSRAKRSKDRFYSSLHAIGKVLNAKRDSSLPGLGDGRGRGPLNFDPEEALTRCEMEIDGLAVFLQTHCVPFFSQIAELVGALDHFSDADLFISRLYSTSHMRDRSDPIFPEKYALSISSRGVADANIHPAPPAFRTFPTPRYWEVNRRRTDGVRRLSYLSNLYAQNAVGHEAGPGRMPSTTMVTEFIPFVKSIGERRHRGNKPGVGGGEDPSLLGAHEFLRLFNQTCCVRASAEAYRSLRDTQRHLLASSTAQEVMEVDDIVDE